MAKTETKETAENKTTENKTTEVQKPKLAHLDFKKVKKMCGDKTVEVYNKIAQIAGGEPGTQHEGGISLVGITDAKYAQIEKLLEVKTETSDEK